MCCAVLRRDQAAAPTQARDVQHFGFRVHDAELAVVRVCKVMPLPVHLVLLLLLGELGLALAWPEPGEVVPVCNEQDQVVLVERDRVPNPCADGIAEDLERREGCTRGVCVLPRRELQVKVLGFARSFG